ncbi:MAG: hypothetical protein U0X75_03150 [Acidobacteriota bacterium]
MTESPDSGQPRFVNYTAADGLPLAKSSPSTKTTTEIIGSARFVACIARARKQAASTGVVRRKPAQFGGELFE